VSRAKPGDPIPGTRRTITAAEVAAGLGLRPGSAPKEAKPTQLSPAQARRVMSGKDPGEPPDIGLEEFTVPAGRATADVWGVDLAKLPVGTEAELGLGRPAPVPDGGVHRLDSPSPERAAEIARAEALREGHHLSRDADALAQSTMERSVDARTNGEDARTIQRFDAEAAEARTMSQKLRRILGRDS
jgi:hypothetical protein